MKLFERRVLFLFEIVNLTQVQAVALTSKIEENERKKDRKREMHWLGFDPGSLGRQSSTLPSTPWRLLCWKPGSSNKDLEVVSLGYLSRIRHWPGRKSCIKRFL